MNHFPLFGDAEYQIGYEMLADLAQDERSPEDQTEQAQAEDAEVERLLASMERGSDE